MDSNYGRGGVTSNEDVLRNFCTNTSEVKANNLSTHYDSNSDELLLRQYGVLIAKRKGDKLMITSKRYSVTTSKVQNELLRIAMEYGLDVQKTNEFAKGGQVTFGSLYNRIVDAVKKDINVSKQEAVQIVNNHETLIVDMIEVSEITNPKEIADIITTSDDGEYAKGGNVRSKADEITFTKSEINQHKKLVLALEKVKESQENLNESCYDNKEFLEEELHDLLEKQEEFLYKIYEKYGYNTRKVLQSLNSVVKFPYNSHIYAKGGEVEHQKLSASLKSKLKSANNILKRYGGREITEHEATMWNVYHNATSGFEAGYEAFDVAGAKNYHNATTREHHAIGDNLIDISRAMTGVDYDDYNFRGTKEENENYYLMNYKNKNYAKGGNVRSKGDEITLTKNEINKYIKFIQKIDELTERQNKLNEDYRDENDTLDIALYNLSVKLQEFEEGLYEKYNDRSKVIDVLSSHYPTYAKGGDIAQGNYEMMLSQAKEVEHHVEELQNILKGEKDIDAWVVAKMENVSSTLSDITHYLDGKTEYANGGDIEDDNNEHLSGYAYYVSFDDVEDEDEFQKLTENVLTKQEFEQAEDNNQIRKFYFHIHIAGDSYQIIPAIYDQMANEGKGSSFSQIIGFDIRNQSGKKFIFTSQLPYEDYDEYKEEEYARGGEMHGEKKSYEKLFKEIVDSLEQDHQIDREKAFKFVYKLDRWDKNKELLEEYNPQEVANMYVDEIEDEDNEYAKGGNIKSKTNKKMATKKTNDGQTAPQIKRWLFAGSKGGYNYYNIEKRPYKKPVDEEKKGAPVGYRFSKFAEEKGITNNRFRKPTKAEVEQYAGKKKNGKLIMYRESRSNKSDVNPKKRI